ncbi:stimulator of interferon genes protein isoform X3 [Zootermopsis nevadensis]|uniref:stimulator of interferon genes protein isoform X3 n=2 Tax=Zootermopsis nevadensis TaxID=136037 RepID=UPI000B8E8DF4|nr:stimulator of interferon genes protein isoform X3 [Zootermopsis nevadensis]
MVELPNERGHTAGMCMIGLISVLLIVGQGMVFCTEGMMETVMYVGSAIGIFTVGLLHVAWRTCFLAEELCHISGRYPDKKSAAQKAYEFNMISSCVCSISAIIAVLIWVILENPYVYLWTKGPVSNIIPYLAGFCFSKLIQMEESVLHTSLQIESMKNLDYGSGMAYNYFYGYLRLVLPDPEVGTPGAKGIRKRIETFMNHHRLLKTAFPVRKLFILIPRNLYTPTDLMEVSTDWHNSTNYWMEAAMSLETQELDRAGVKQRVYKNSVYKIWNRDRSTLYPVYVVAEGATPLKTFYDVIKMNPKMSRVFKNHQHEIVSAFYKTLQDILRDSDDCRDLCEIIFYADTDENQRRVNVARIILERIEKLTR